MDYFVGKLGAREIFYDIGGFRGAYSAAVKVCLNDGASVHVFEPVPQNVAAINAVVELNNFSNFKVNPLAVGDGTPIVGAVGEKDDMLRVSERKTINSNTFSSTSVDEYVAAGNPVPTLIKIDVEGFEYQVLKGAAKVLKQHHPRLWLEIHPTFLKNQGKSADQVLSLIKDFGYSTTFFSDRVPENEIAYHVWCEK
jgi:FkbM family methyltransferase